MFVREKKIKGYSYLYLVETVREGKRTKQRIIKNLGRKDVVLANGGLERLAASIARFAATVEVRGKLEAGQLSASELEALCSRRVGAPLLFGRLWEETGCSAVLDEMLKDRGFDFSVERAVFATVLHRIMVSGSDRSCATWLADYAIPDVEGLALHHFYRAMAWLGEELDEADQADATPFSPRTTKDEIEERLFARRRDLFTDLSVVFMDTTSLSFEGEGGEALGQHGHSKDKRPDLKQTILAAVIDNDGRPICSEMMPGNTVDVRVLLPIVDRLPSATSIVCKRSPSSTTAIPSSCELRHKAPSAPSSKLTASRFQKTSAPPNPKAPNRQSVVLTKRAARTTC